MNKMTLVITIILAVLIAAAAVSGCTSVDTNLLPSSTATPNSSSTGAAQEPLNPLATARPSSAAVPTALSPSATARPSPTAIPNAMINASVTPTPTPTPTPIPVSDTAVILNVTGDVKKPLALTKSALSNYPQVSIVNHYYGAHGSFYYMTATGASLNAILDEAQPISEGGSTWVYFYGTDDYVGYIPLSVIRNNASSMISYNWTTTDTDPRAGEGLRNIQPNQFYAQMWVFKLYKIEVKVY